MSESETAERVKALVSVDRVLISDHGYDELVADRILFADIIHTVGGAVVVEDYPDAPKGPTGSRPAKRWTGRSGACGVGNSKGI